MDTSHAVDAADDLDDPLLPRSEAKQNRRTRFQTHLSPKMRKWLTATSRVHARLCAIVRLYNSPKRAGEDIFTVRLTREDKTLLFDALNAAAFEIDLIREQVSAEMGKALPTSAPPGSHEKVSEMAARFDRGEWLFIDGDAKNANR
jgi:hypothetical protein